MGVIPTCLGILFFLLALFSLATPAFAAGYTDAFLRASFTISEMPQSQPVVLGVNTQRIRNYESRFTGRTYIVQPTTKNPTPMPIVKKTQPVSGGGNAAIMAAINSYRQSKGLSAVATDPYTCGFARTRAAEISTNFSHDGFRERIDAKTLPYPTYSAITENIAMAGSFGDVVPMWINSPGHAKNLEADTPYVCVESAGNYYAFEGWKP